MSYLAFNASPYNESTNINNSSIDNDEIEKKRQQRNKTIKKRLTNDINPKVKEMFNTINGNTINGNSNIINDNNGYEADNLGDDMANFNPPGMPQSTVPLKKTVVENTNLKKQSQEQTSQGQSSQGQSSQDSPITTEAFNNLPNTYSNDYYKQYVPYYNQMSQSSGNKDQLLEKLNYMIHLLEEQKDEKTGHIMEELILYSFLGIFMIFIVDSFARAGKYVR
jgi:hypothetical protein